MLYNSFGYLVALFTRLCRPFVFGDWNFFIVWTTNYGVNMTFVGFMQFTREKGFALLNDVQEGLS